MVLSYFKLAFRLLLRNPFFTLINILGLSVGFVVFFVLWQYSQQELQSDRFHQNWNDIYRCGMIAKWTDDKVNWEESVFGTNDAAFTAQLAAQYSEIDDLTRVFVQQNFTPGLHFKPYL